MNSSRSNKITEEHFHKQFNMNVLGLILTTQEAVKHFDADGGSIINISSVVSTSAPAGWLGLQRHQGGGGCGDQIAGQGTGRRARFASTPSIPA